MKALKMLAVAALVLAPVTAVAAPASAATAGSQLISKGGAVATPAGWGNDLSIWFCKNYGLACG
ncbi:hypothetical protein [Glutamicibacter soli]|uniref:hypothetical protein n=1 Tax=Glutamicibacter soli TaxID=453836 RepID=UPI0011BF545A|nr:hypothetical protein [Glutamicibacter soli]